MLIRTAIEERLAQGARDEVRLVLPRSLKSDDAGARVGLLKRLASSRTFALGDRAGVLRAAQNRSGRPFRLDVRQKVIVKALVSRHLGRGADRAAALCKHVVYLGRQGAGVDGERAEFFDRDQDGLDPKFLTQEWSEDRHHFRFIISPEHGDRLEMKSYTREVMGRVCADLGDSEQRWIATCHFDTDQPHAHVLMRGRRADGRDLVIPRDCIGYGFRARAQEVAQERLGDLSRVAAERRIWKETEADRFTGFDRRLVAQMDENGLVDDGVGATDAWAALTRGRLRHLERLGLATRQGRRYRLDSDLEPKLRSLQIRRDVIRTLNQRRLETNAQIRLTELAVRGVVMKSGSHDELGASPWVIVRDSGGTEHYARLRPGGTELNIGQAISVKFNVNGLGTVFSSVRGASFGQQTTEVTLGMDELI